MGLFDWLKGMLGGAPPSPTPAAPSPPAAGVRINPFTQEVVQLGIDRRTSAPSLHAFRYRSSLVRTPPSREFAAKRPYPSAQRQVYKGWLDLTTDSDPRWLEHFGLPPLKSPDDLAKWLNVPLGRLNWLSGRYRDGGHPGTAKEAHYHFQVIPKRSGGARLLEAPKPQLKAIQQRILRDILDRIPVHSQAHGFSKGRSIVTNAEPHVGKRIILKYDLENFYPSVRYNRVVAIFRSIGFSREVGIWLARLTTSALPWNTSDIPRLGELSGLETRGRYWELYGSRHLPQGAATSPALANLSAYSLDVRLSGLARKFDADYTRYADDITFSGTKRFAGALSDFIPLVERVVRAEKFVVHKGKRRVLRNNQRQSITGVVVNSKPNIRREEFDRLKAILHNCLKYGPSTQNRDRHPRFADHLRGRVAFVSQLNADRGEKLREMYDRIDWRK
ncbi:MAG: RNA-directed DNA polymerase [Planctomycetaceae bacterium]|nr:RNA-directed DNA polymerase [Planctomycetaceae bacterium]